MFRKLHKILLVALVVSSIGCNSDYTRIIIKNNTTKKIEKVGVTSYGVNIVFKDLEPGTEVARKVFIKGKSNYEGGFYVIVYSEGKIRNFQILGYFANSSDIKPKYNFMIYDKFLIREK